MNRQETGKQAASLLFQAVGKTQIEATSQDLRDSVETGSTGLGYMRRMRRLPSDFRDLAG